MRRPAFALFRNRSKGQRAIRKKSNATISWQSDKRDSQERALIDPQIALTNEVVPAMKNGLAEDPTMVGMRQGELS
jgi:hypothetical protein